RKERAAGPNRLRRSRRITSLLDGGRILQPVVIWSHGRDALDDALRGGQCYMLESDRHQAPSYGIDQLAGLQQEVRVARPAIPLVPDCKSFVDQQAITSHAGNDVRQDWSPQIIRDDHSGKSAVAKRKGAPVLEIGLDELDAGPLLQIDYSGKVAIDAHDLISVRKCQPEMATAAAGDVEHPSAFGNTGEEPPHPR